MPRRALLVVNREKPSVLGALDEVRSVISLHGDLVGELSTRDDVPGDIASRADMMVVLGGDGTLLGQIRRSAGHGLPTVGVNFGRLGFLAAFDLDSMRTQAADLFGGEGQPEWEPRMLLSVEARCGETGDTTCRETVLNDAAIVAGPPYRMIEVTMELDGVRGPTVAGDGVIVATPSGSTAYSVSSGGPIVAPTVASMSVSAIAAHSLSFRPIVVPDTCEVVLHMRRVNDSRGPGAPDVGTTLVLDGQIMRPLRTGDTVTVARSNVAAKLVVNRQRNYYETLMAKMHWAAPPGRVTDGGPEAAGH